MRCVFCHFIHSLSCHCNLLTWCVSWLFLRSNSSRLVLLARPEQNAAKHSCGQNSSSKIEYAVLWYFSEHKQQINHWLFLYLLLCMNIDACLESGPLGSKNYIYSFTSLETNTSDIGLERWTTRDDEWSDHIDTLQWIHQTWIFSNVCLMVALAWAAIYKFIFTEIRAFKANERNCWRHKGSRGWKLYQSNLIFISSTTSSALKPWSFCRRDSLSSMVTSSHYSFATMCWSVESLCST